MESWDSEIDEVARGMIDGRPGAAFTARVLARLDGAGSRQTVRSAAWITLTGAVAAAVVVAVVVVRAPWNTAGPAPRTQATRPTTATGIPIQREPGISTSDRPANSASAVGASDDPPGVVIRPAPTASAAAAIEARRAEMFSVPPIQVERLDANASQVTEAIRVPAFEVPVLDVPALAAIAPLEVPAMGDD